MKNKIIVFALLAIVYLLVYAWLFVKGKQSKFLVLSFLISTIPFQMSIPIFTPEYLSGTGTGTFSSKIFLTIPFALLITLSWWRKKEKLLKFRRNERWILWLFVLIIISLVNPANTSLWSTVGFAVLFISYILFYKLMYIRLNANEVVSAIFTALTFLCLIQFCLAILFPVLQVKQVTGWFQSEGLEWATRRDTRAGAIGVFVTPANLGMFLTIASGFFLSTYLTAFRKKTSLILILLNLVTVYLTYSRTSYISQILIVFSIIYLYRNAKNPIISIKTVIFGLIPSFSVLISLIFFSPLGDIFLKSNAEDMVQARFDHWVVGWEIFNSFPLFGVGINSHVEYINQTLPLFNEIHNKFLTSNPIHNSHLIIVAETGILGFLLWLALIVSSITKAKFNITHNVNTILSLSQVAMLLAYIIYGVVDWAPLSPSIFPIFLLLTYFSNAYSLDLNRFRDVPVLKINSPAC